MQEDTFSDGNEGTEATELQAMIWSQEHKQGGHWKSPGSPGGPQLVTDPATAWGGKPAAASQRVPLQPPRSMLLGGGVQANGVFKLRPTCDFCKHRRKVTKSRSSYKYEKF